MNFSERMRAAAKWPATFVLLFAAACVVLRPSVAASGVLRGLGLCYQTVIPALFPFMVLSRLLLESPAAQWFGLLLRPYTRLLGLREKKAPAALLCGLLGGFACGAQAVDALYRSGRLRRDEAALLLVCAIGSGPGFVVGGVGALMLGRAGAGRLLLAAQVGASLLCGAGAACCAALQRGRAPAFSPHGMRRAAVACAGTAANSPKRPPSLKTAAETPKAPQSGFVFAVRSAVEATAALCGYVTLFSFFAAIAVPESAPPLLRFFAMLPLEVTGACRAACETAGAWRSELCCAALSVMGASVFFQVRALTAPEISLAPLLCSRLAHLPLALLLFRALTRLFPGALAAGATLDAAILPAVRMPPDVMAVLFVLAALSCGAVRPHGGALHGGRG